MDAHKRHGMGSRSGGSRLATIGIYSVKGGVGKTTLASNLAWCSGTIDNRETLVWDLDQSGGVGFLLGYDSSGSRQTVALFDADRNPRRLVCDTAIGKVKLLPADEELRYLEVKLSRIGNRNRIGRIAQDLSKDFSRILIDCPPVQSELSLQVIRAVDLVIVPLPPSPLSTRAFAQVTRQVKESGMRHPPMLPVLSMVDMRRKLHRDAVAEAPGWPVIPFSSAAEQCAVRSQPVGQFARTSVTAKAIERLHKAIEAKLADMGKA